MNKWSHERAEAIRQFIDEYFMENRKSPTVRDIFGESVFLTQRVHLFPFRTQKLSPAVPTILDWRRSGKIGQSRHHYRKTKFNFVFLFHI